MSSFDLLRTDSPALFWGLQALGIPLGLAASNVAEWTLHRFVLHGPGKKPRSFWSFHFHEHHQAARRHAMIDSKYETSPFHWNSQGKELLGIVLTVGLFVPLVPWAPLFVLTLLYGACDYYRKHRRSHLDPQWAREHLPWHYDHHMGPDQDANWCVTHPWFDDLVGTRQRYVGTPREAEDLERARRRAEATGASVVPPSPPAAGATPAPSADVGAATPVEAAAR